MVEAAVDEIGLRLSAPRLAHQREGRERFTLDRILAEEAAVMDLVDARNDRSRLWVKDEDTAGLSPEQKQVVENIGRSPWLVQPLSAPAGAGKTTSLRALAAAARHRYDANVLVLAPTGKAVDVAMREGAGDTGLTVAKALASLRDNTVELNQWTLVVVDEAAMVGTDDLRQLLTATTKAGAKTVLVGDAHQLAPVKARGGMFAQLCTDLPWTQHLNEVWRMRDPAERTASLALRDGEPEAVRKAVDWYRTHDRLHCGDAITMAADALDAYQADTEAGRDALLVCDTTEMANAINTRLHHQHLNRDAPTVAGAGGQRIGVGDLILSRRNDPTIDFHHSTPHAETLAPVRNGNRWRVVGLDEQKNWLGAERLEDGARVIFHGDYLREHVTFGYAVTVHSAQGVTADTSHAVLGENTSRALLYVAMTRGRHTNTAHLYQRATGDHQYGHPQPDGTHLTNRGDNHEAADLMRGILANDQPAITAHDYAAHTLGQALPDRVRSLLQRRATATDRRHAVYQAWQTERQAAASRLEQAREEHISRSRDRSSDYGIEI
jgi:ATP-dependent exoDNAse (exonuclease V) alpha subunit